MMKVFATKLKETMEDLKLTQKQLAAMTGCSKATVSQYLSDTNIPPITKRMDMAEALGLQKDFFEREDPGHRKGKRKRRKWVTNQVEHQMENFQNQKEVEEWILKEWKMKPWRSGMRG